MVYFRQMARSVEEKPMTDRELVEQQAVAFRALLLSRGWPKQPDQPGFSGSLGDVFLPPEIVDEMEAAINDAFERACSEDCSSDHIKA